MWYKALKLFQKLGMEKFPYMYYHSYLHKPCVSHVGLKSLNFMLKVLVWYLIWNQTSHLADIGLFDKELIEVSK